MQVTLKLYATLAEYLPATAESNKTVLTVAENTTPYAILEHYQVPKERTHLVLLNGVYLTPEQCQQPSFIKDGDTLAVWPPVAGG